MYDTEEVSALSTVPLAQSLVIMLQACTRPISRLFPTLIAPGAGPPSCTPPSGGAPGNDEGALVGVLTPLHCAGPGEPGPGTAGYLAMH